MQRKHNNKRKKQTVNISKTGIFLVNENVNISKTGIFLVNENVLQAS